MISSYVYTGSNLFCKNRFSNVQAIRAQLTSDISVRPAWAIIIYLRIANVFACLYSSRMTLLIESCMSGIHEECSIKEKKFCLEHLVKITKNTYRVFARCSILAVYTYIRRFSKFMTIGRLFPFRLIKRSHARTKRVLRARHWKRNGEERGYREEATASLQLYKAMIKRSRELWKRSGFMKNRTKLPIYIGKRKIHHNLP